MRYGLGYRVLEYAIRFLTIAVVLLIVAGANGWLTRIRTLDQAGIVVSTGRAFAVPNAWGKSWIASIFYPSDSLESPYRSNMVLHQASSILWAATFYPSGYR